MTRTGSTAKLSSTTGTEMLLSKLRTHFVCRNYMRQQNTKKIQ